MGTAGVRGTVWHCLCLVQTSGAHAAQLPTLCRLTALANSEGTKLNLTALTRYKAQKHKHVSRDLRIAVVTHSKPRPWMITDDSNERFPLIRGLEL